MSDGKAQTRRGRKPKDKTVEQYSIKEVSTEDSSTKKKTQRGRKSNQSKQQNQDVLSSIQLDSTDQNIDQQDTVFRVANLESSSSQNQHTLDLDPHSINFINNYNLIQDQDQLTTDINNLQINDSSQQPEQDIQVVDNFLSSSSIFQTPIDLQYNPDNSGFFQQTNVDQQTKKKKEDKSKLQIPSYTQYQKIQQKQGKILQEKELPQIINLSNKDGKWPQFVSSWCSYDCHPFTTTPIGIPVEITPDRKFKMQSYCCSLNCAMALIHQNNTPDLYKQINYLMEFQRQFFNSTENIPRAPAKELLKQFGGEFSIEQFRHSFQTFEQSLYSQLYEPFESSQIIQQGQAIEKINPKPQYDTNKSIPTELQVYQNL